MNGMNKTIFSVVSALALIYSGISFALSLDYYITEKSVHIWIFAPVGFSGIEDLGIDITRHLMEIAPGMEQGFYSSILNGVVDLVPGIGSFRFHIIMVMILVGFILSVVGFITLPSGDCTGPAENPKQYLWTHRPRALLRCMMMPWNIITAAWKKSKPLVILPILLIFLYFPWSILISLALIVPFFLEKLVVASKISSAAKREEKEYQKNTDYGICPNCKRSFERPKVKCRCGFILDYPVPNEFGYKYHVCNKGHEISCESGKRSGLTTICPHCKKQIATREARPITISLIGGTNTGKTTLMLAAVETLAINARMVDITVSSPSMGLSKQAIAAKDYAPKTAPGELESQLVFLESLNIQTKEIIFNDISGVEFQPKADKEFFEEYYNYTNGFVFTFDPLSLNREIKRETPHEVFDSFHYMYTTIRGIGPSTVSKVPFAIVATKSDLVSPRLDDANVRQYLIDHGEDGFVRVVESLFSDVRYFSVCSHGTECSSALRPVWWIVDHADKELTKLIPLR